VDSEEVLLMNLVFFIRKKNWILLIVFIVTLLYVGAFSAKANTTNPDGETKQEVSGNLVYLPLMQFGNSYFLSPTGDDNNNGNSPEQAWATFDRAWLQLQPGDTLVLLDGVYHQSIHPQNIGEIGNPVTIRAQNDGQAIIDGEGVRIPILIEKYRNSYLAISGIIARNSSESVYKITGDHNILQRVSGYDANTDENAMVISISGDYNLLEDCVAAGTGRKMIVVFKGEHNIIRRCFVDWREWDGRNWRDCWPWGEGIEIYTASYNIIENSIAYGHTARAAISLLAQGGAASNGNKILGAMAISSGMEEDGTPMVWNPPRPQPSVSQCVAEIYEWPQYMSGFGVAVNGGILHDNLLQDILAWGSARYGLSFNVTASNNDINNNYVNRATVFNNGLNELTEPYWGPLGSGARTTELVNFSSIDNSNIENIWTGSTFISQTGEGARLTYRYIDGVMTTEPLWPWPMEDRIMSELGYSVTNMMMGIISGSP